MRKSLILIALMATLGNTTSYGQGMSVNASGTPAAASAMLDVSSTTQGVLVPRMKQADRDAISSPATGLLIYQTDNTPGFYVYNGTAWIAVSGTSGATGTAGGDLTGTYPNPTLASSGVILGTYGSATQVPKYTVDGTGRITSASNVSITGTTPGGSAGGDLTGTYPNPTLDNSGVILGTYGSATQVPKYTVDGTGRITSASNVSITGTTPGGSAGGDLTGTYPSPTIAAGVITAAKIADGTITGTQIAASTITSGLIASVDGTTINNASIPTTRINATGTANSTTYLRGDGAWSSPPSVANGSAAGQIYLTGSTPFAVQGPQDVTGDVTISSTAVTTLKSVITAGSVGSASAIPVITYDAKGRITAVTTATPGGGLSAGTTAGEIYVTGTSGAVPTTPVASLPAAAFPALTGDVTTTAGSLATTIADSAITIAKIKTTAGAADSITYLRGDGKWGTPDGTGASPTAGIPLTFSTHVISSTAFYASPTPFGTGSAVTGSNFYTAYVMTFSACTPSITIYSTTAQSFALEKGTANGTAVTNSATGADVLGTCTTSTANSSCTITGTAVNAGDMITLHVTSVVSSSGNLLTAFSCN